MSVPFRFDAGSHTYTAQDTGEAVISITGMLKRCRLVDDQWFTEESSERGTWVHERTADYDLGLLDLAGVAAVVSPWKGYLTAHVGAMGTVKPTFIHVETPAVHPFFRFSGRIDRVLLVNKLRGVWEVKTTASRDPSHQVQTALQAILDSAESGIPPEHTRRWACYLRNNGRFTVVEHTDRRDFDVAKECITTCCR